MNIVFKILEWGRAEDFEKHKYLEDFLNAFLGTTGYVATNTVILCLSASVSLSLLPSFPCSLSSIRMYTLTRTVLVSWHKITERTKKEKQYIWRHYQIIEG